MIEIKDCIIPTFDVLTADQISKINDSSYLVKHRKNEMLFIQNAPLSHVLYLKSGLVKLYREIENERKVILHIFPPGHFVGLVSAFYDTRCQYSASFIDNSEVIYCEANLIREIIRENGNYSLNLMKILSDEAIAMMEKMISISQKQVTGRLAEVLLFFAQKIYKQNTFSLPLSRQELAELISSTKESISRTLTEFKNDRIIALDDKRIELKSIDLLQILSKIG